MTVKPEGKRGVAIVAALIVLKIERYKVRSFPLISEGTLTTIKVLHKLKIISL